MLVFSYLQGTTHLVNTADHILIAGLPKAATTFIELSIAATTGLPHIDLCDTYATEQRLDPEALHRFMQPSGGVGGKHMPASPLNLALLTAYGIDRVAVLTRDPRDCIVSQWHHLNRTVMRDTWRRHIHAAAGLVPMRYYDLPREAQIAALVRMTLPRYDAWLRDWLKVSESGIINIRFIRYEDFVATREAAIIDILEWFSRKVDNVIFPPDGEREDGVDSVTNFRRGLVGSFRDELPLPIARQLDEHVPPDLRQFYLNRGDGDR